jgi:hypothetical protein
MDSSDTLPVSWKNRERREVLLKGAPEGNAVTFCE